MTKVRTLRGSFPLPARCDCASQCRPKHYQATPPAGVEVIEQLIAGMDAEDADLGIVVTSGTFSSAAVDYVAELARSGHKRVELIDGEQFAAMIVDCGLGSVSLQLVGRGSAL